MLKISALSQHTLRLNSFSTFMKLFSLFICEIRTKFATKNESMYHSHLNWIKK